MPTLAMSPFSCSSSSDCCVWAARVTVVAPVGGAVTVLVATEVTTCWGSCGGGEGVALKGWLVADSGGVLMNSMRPPSTQMFGVRGYGGEGGEGNAHVGGADLRLFSYATRCAFSSLTGCTCLQRGEIKNWTLVKYWLTQWIALA